MYRLTASLVLLGWLATPAAADTVVQTLKVGDNIEAGTYVGSGRWAGKVLLMDGNDVVAVSLSPTAARRGAGDAAHPDRGNHYGLGLLKHERSPASAKAFDVLAFPREHRSPRGIAYLPTTREFVFTSKQPTALLFVTDETGTFTRTLSPPVPSPQTWSNWEGAVWIPADAPAHGGTLAVLGAHTDYLSHVYFVRLDGSIEGDITPTPGTPLESYLCGIGYRAGLLYATACDDQIWAMDLDGNVLGDAPAVIAAEQSEVLAFDDAGGLHTSGYETAILRSYDASFARRPALDVDFSTGFGVTAAGLTHRADTGELLVLSRVNQRLFAIRDDLRTARLLGDSNSHGEMAAGLSNGLSYLGGDTVAISHRGFPRGVEAYHWPDDTIPFHLLFDCCSDEPDPFPPGADFAPIGVAPWGADAFLVSVGGDRQALKVVTRAGTPLDMFPTALRPARLADLALSAPFRGFSVQVFDAGAGTRILAGDSLYDGSGTLLHVFDADSLGLTDSLGAITWVGGDRFVTVDGDTSTLVVFTAP